MTLAHRRLLVVLTLLIAVPGCSGVFSQLHTATGSAPLCMPDRELGRVVVLPETAWRIDQKDVPEREAMALRALDRAFSIDECGGDTDVRELSNWSSVIESSWLDALGEEGAETVVFVRIEEVGPTVAVTFSLPLLWISTSEAQLRVRAIHVPTREVLLDAGLKRSVGGPFQLRPAAWAEAELEAALLALLRATETTA